MKRLIVLTILTIALLFPTISYAFDSAYSGAQVDAEIARAIGRNTTIANPGSDAELVTEQAVREALDALSLGTASTRDAEDVMTNGSNLPDGAAIKTYGDANWGGAGTLVFKTHDAPQGTNPVADLVEDTLQWLEGEGIDITGSSAADSITIKGEDASAANKGIASFNSTRFTVVAGAVDIATVAGITGANEDDVTLADIQGACTNDFHNIGGVDDERTQEEIDDYVNALIKDADSVHTRITITYDDPNNAFDFVVDDMNDDVPDAGDFGAAEDLNANGALNTGCVAGNEIASTAVVAGSYTNTNLTVDDDGRITAAANGSGSSPPAGSQGDMLYKGASAWLAGNMFINAAAYTGTDRAKIQAAINEAQSNGGIVYVPTGTWVVDDHDADGNCLEITGGITFIGDGPRKTIIQTVGTNDAILYVNTGDPVVIKNLYLQYSTASVTTGANAITLTAPSGQNSDSIIRDIYIQNAEIGINALKAARYLFDNVTIYNDDGVYGMYITNTNHGDTGDSKISNCTIMGPSSPAANSAGIYYGSSAGLKITNSKMQSWDQGIYLNWDVGANEWGIFQINNCSLEDNASWSIKANTVGSSTFGTLLITGNQLRNGVLLAGIADANIKHVSINGNYIYSDSQAGVRIEHARNVMIDGNVFEGTGGNHYAIDNVNSSTEVYVGMNTYHNYPNAYYLHNIVQNSIVAKEFYVWGESAGNPSVVLTQAGTVKAQWYYDNSGYTAFSQTGTTYWKKRSDSSNLMSLTDTGNFYAAGNITAGGSCCDYVFEDDYDLVSLDSLAKHIEIYTRLPGITSEEGISMSELYEKTEEQALYILQLHERVKTLEARLN